MESVYIALGSNLNDPLQQINAAIEALKTIPHSELVTVSSFYRTKPSDRRINRIISML